MASAKAERGAHGFQSRATRGDVVEIGLAEGQGFAGAGEVVLFGRDGAEGVLMACALGLDRLGGSGAGRAVEQIVKFGLPEFAFQGMFPL
jgi:hypothetical protein